MTPTDNNELPSGFLLPFTAGQGEGGDALPQTESIKFECALITAIWLASFVALAVICA